jgi:starch-binding outer membrane protein, SusD/RagB family
MRNAFRFGGRTIGTLSTAIALVFSPACSSITDSVLEVEDPDLIMPANVNSLPGARAVANGALGRFVNMTAGNEGTWLYGGLLTDEWTTSSTFIQNDETDQRKVQLLNTQVTGFYRNINRVRTAADQAIPLLNEFDPTNKALLAEMYFARGYAEMQLALDFCNGIPLSNGAGTEIVYDEPRTGQEIFQVAVASFDSAIAIATGTDAQSVLVATAAKVAKGRALMALNQYAAAAQAVAGVATSFKYQHTFSLTTSSNIIWNQGFSAKRYSVGDSIDGNNRDILVRNAIPFYSAKDPRLPVTDTKLNAQPTVGQDGGTIMRLTQIYDRLTPIDVVNGIDARLIEAENQLKNNDVAGWLATLNGLRQGANRVTTLGTVTIGATALPLLTDPGTPAARISLMFREKAFWTFARGQRLGDLRRLVRQYNRAPTDVFPEGVHFKAGTFGSDVNLPVVTDEENNPNFKGCLDRNA